MDPSKKQTLPLHPIGEKGHMYLKSLTERERDLHLLAQQQLGSSYFVEKSDGFRKWLKAEAEKAEAALKHGSV
jgi:hypothetical protein